MLGVCYLIVSVVALSIAYFTPVPLCWIDSCQTVPGILGLSWLYWGALFYAVSGIICSMSPKKNIIGVFLTVGAAFHMGLIIYEYGLTGTVCPVCLKFAVADTSLAILYWILPNKRFKPINVVSSIFGVTLIAVVLYSALSASQTQIKSFQSVAQAQEQPIEQSQEKVPTLLQATTPVLSKEIEPALSQETAPALEANENNSLQVSTPDGQNTSIDLRDKPALFFSVWCTHCDQVLPAIAKTEHEKRPYLVVTYLDPEDINKIANKLAAAGLGGEPYYTVPEPPFGIKEVPALVYNENKYICGMNAILE